MAISYRLKHVQTGDIQITESVQRKVFLEGNGYRIDAPAPAAQSELDLTAPKAPKDK